MRRVTWHELVKMPVGTIFSDEDYGTIGTLWILGNVLNGPDDKPIDYVHASLLPRLISAYTMGCSRPVDLDENADVVQHPSGFGRDGLYGKDRTYWVWDQTDRTRLALWLLDPMQAVEEMNDDDCIVWRPDGGRLREDARKSSLVVRRTKMKP